MSSIDLMLLGELMRKNMSAYEMKKMMELKEIQFWVKISSPSIFKNLVALHKKGYIEGKTVKESEMPEKTVYSINDKGRAYFMDLMMKYSGEPGMVYMDFSAFVANLHNVDPKTGLTMIADLKETLAQVRDLMTLKIENKKNYIPYHGLSLMELYQQMYTGFYNWADQLYEDYKSNEDC